MEGGFESRGEGEKGPDKEFTNYYELALRVIGSYLDSQRPHDVFFFEQEGSFVVRLFGTTGHAGGHSTRGIHPRGDVGYDREGAAVAAAPIALRGRTQHQRGDLMKALKVLAISIGALLAALIVIPLTILAGLFVWLKLTEETDDDEMELDDAI